MFPDSVETIDSFIESLGMFPNLKKINTPKSLKYTAPYTFRNSNIEQMFINSDGELIKYVRGKKAFDEQKGKNKSQKFIIPKNVKEIKIDAFSDASFIEKELVFNDNIIAIPSLGVPLYLRNNIEKIILPTKLKALYKSAFEGFPNVKKILFLIQYKKCNPFVVVMHIH